MPVPRLYTSQDLNPGQMVELEKAPALHLSQVLRRIAGDDLILFNGDGHDYRALILEAQRGKRVRVQVARPVSPQPEAEPPLRISLALGVSKGERMEFALQKAVELGVYEMQPLFTGRGVVRLSGERLAKRHEHWQGVVISACEQSGRRRLPVLHPTRSLSDWLQASHALTGDGILLHHRADQHLTALPAPTAGAVTLLIGPEGGLAEAEREAALSRGFVAVTLGPRVMRTETAPLAAIAALQALWGDFR